MINKIWSGYQRRSNMAPPTPSSLHANIWWLLRNPRQVAGPSLVGYNFEWWVGQCDGNVGFTQCHVYHLRNHQNYGWLLKYTTSRIPMPPCELPQRSQGRKAAAWDTAVGETGNIGPGKKHGQFPTSSFFEIGFYYTVVGWICVSSPKLLWEWTIHKLSAVSKKKTGHCSLGTFLRSDGSNSFNQIRCAHVARWHRGIRLTTKCSRFQALQKMWNIMMQNTVQLQRISDTMVISLWLCNCL